MVSMRSLLLLPNLHTWIIPCGGFGGMIYEEAE
jgi:hypothetical protein